ncbi:Alpha/Beta hydrolase protein [Aspergillus pseudonomiae]|uniref:Alpha/Beta hydrolase protein n=1 Tax=Aspergillus pseudonomiae TaxID=1506151 RepID=A0A5N6I5A7_9EURO|nr:Alpha/Beta hydrolase protein [Aspergillus pseudonomiae]KAB8261558.1 Alpha/Beta hydrolase protein [Aspergillus pseudonomiae]KAE8398104.1 Alpha/Beta hydrolase protein [Aspergillus pseudonomiae]
MVVLSTEWLELEEALGNRPLLKGSPEEIKKQYSGLMTFLAANRPPPDPYVSANDMTIAGVKCRVYTPGSPATPRPVGIYTHGGGFVCGDLDSEDALCRVISKAVDCILVSVDYRLGPEHKLPAMLQDTLAVYQWVWENASQLGGNPAAFFSIGGSAGAGLALAVANHYAQRADGRKYIKGVVALVPLALHWDNVPAEYKGDYTSYDDNADNVPVIDKSTMESFYQAVAADPNDSNIFTALSPHLPNFPPTYICTCGADPLRDDGTIMEKSLRKSGVPTKLSTYPNLPHYFWIFPDLEASGGFINDVISGTNWVISQFPTLN